MPRYFWFLGAALVLVLASGWLDRRFRANGRLRFWLSILCAGVVLLVTVRIKLALRRL